jgi:hypothetical protein
MTLETLAKPTLKLMGRSNAFAKKTKSRLQSADSDSGSKPRMYE